MLRVVVLVSGGGTNLQAIIDAVDNGAITNTEIVGVISNNKNAYALERAKAQGIPGQCISPKDYETREEFNDALLRAVDELNADLLVLAGFLVVIPEKMIEAYRNRIINIHPSLIPAIISSLSFAMRSIACGKIFHSACSMTLRCKISGVSPFSTVTYVLSLDSLAKTKSSLLVLPLWQ